MGNPKVVFLFSGKRKSGKDFFTDKFLSSLPPGSAVVVRVSGPLKQQYALQHNLDYDELLSASQYKEQHRLNMITWSEAIRNKDPVYFIDKAIEMYKADQFPVWIVSDMRRMSDLAQFRGRYGASCVTVRVTASEETRVARGWTFTPGVDDAESECDLDGVLDWDHTIDTSAGDEDSVQDLLETLQQLCSVRGAPT